MQTVALSTQTHHGQQLCLYALFFRYPYRFLFLYFVSIPFPVKNLRHVLSMFINVLFMFDELVPNQLLESGTSDTQLWQPVYHILYQVKPVKIIQNCHVEVSCNGAFFLIAPDMHIFVISTTVS